LKEIGKPLHFTEIAKFIEKANVHTVHNELIKDPKFVLIGRGIYALAEWGYEKGQVKDIILKIFKEEKRPLTKDEIVEKVLKQRMVKKSTILTNLSDKKYFLRDEEGRYYPKVEIA
jgi:DNA-directed RNA polymerase delta subunit